MTFNPLVPLNSDSPSIFPAQNQTNMTRLQTLLGADHQFNLTADANDGYHNLIHMTQQAPSGALAATGRLYVKSSGGTINLFYMNESGTEYQITPILPIRAAVSFTGNAAVGVCALRSYYNVTSVTKDSTGLYTLVFAAGIMPDANYIAHITGMRSGTGEVFGFIQGAAVASSSQTATTLKIGFQSSGGSPRDVIIGNVTIFSVS